MRRDLRRGQGDLLASPGLGQGDAVALVDGDPTPQVGQNM